MEAESPVSHLPGDRAFLASTACSGTRCSSLNHPSQCSLALRPSGLRDSVVRESNRVENGSACNSLSRVKPGTRLVLADLPVVHRTNVAIRRSFAVDAPSLTPSRALGTHDFLELSSACRPVLPRTDSAFRTRGWLSPRQ